MIQQYKSFLFNNTLFTNLLNVSLGNDFYVACLRGSRSIKEEKIPGRDLPYFFEIDDEPIEFDVHFAIENPLTMTDIKNITKNLIKFTTYKQLHFGNYINSTYTRKTPIFNVIFTNEPDFNFIGAGKNSSNIDTYVGYFTLHARADRPYGYEIVKIIYEKNATISLQSGALTFNTEDDSPIITTANTASLYVGQTITGAGIPSNTTILSITNSTTLVMSKDATATASSVSLSFSPISALVSGLIENHNFQANDIISADSNGGTLGAGIVTVQSVLGTTMIVRSTASMTNGNISDIKSAIYPTATFSGGTFNIASDMDLAPGIFFKKIGNSTNKIRLYNATNNTSVTFTNLLENERISISAALKTINSNSSTPIYPRWEKDELVITDGENIISFQTYVDPNWTNVSNSDIIEGYTITMEAPSFLKGD
jgi:hypothetical protein